MDWNWFLPSLRNPDKMVIRGPTRIAWLAARWLLPGPLRSDPNTGREGLIRRILGLLGPTWAATPVRRVIQAAGLLLFVWLFAYVTWPYTARPARRWPGWIPVEVAREAGRLRVATDEGRPPDFPPGTLLYVEAATAGEAVSLGRFRVTRVGPDALHLEPIEPLGPERWDELSTRFGPWSLCEREPGTWPAHYAEDLRRKEGGLEAELFLMLDPVASLSAAVAGRVGIAALAVAGAILLVCLVIPRGFRAYVCPLGTVIDLFDWAVSRRVRRLRVAETGWWVHLKYYLLVAVLAAAGTGVLLCGFVAAIPVVTRAMAFLVSPVEMGFTRGWHQVPEIGAGHVVSIVLFGIVLALGLLRPRFWCKYVCPTGAVFSVANLLRLNQRRVEATCTGCGQCVEICPFDAIRADFTTRTANCTFCQACGGVCPTHSIRFVGRWTQSAWKVPETRPAAEPRPGRRRFLAAASGAAGGLGLAAATRLLGPGPTVPPVVRPPGSVPEPEFLALCLRCGQCYQACPNNVLQPIGWQNGLERLWTPRVTPDWSGCEPSCANCGQVCPTGAIRPLPLKEKRVARIGLAVVNQKTCLPHAGREPCQLCVDECVAAGYEAIEFVRVHAGGPSGETGTGTGAGLLAPVVLAEKCVGCGLCQTRCYAIHVKSKGLLAESAIRVEAGPGKEDRTLRGSYRALRAEEARRREAARKRQQPPEQPDGRYLPDFLDRRDP